MNEFPQIVYHTMETLQFHFILRWQEVHDRLNLCGVRPKAMFSEDLLQLEFAFLRVQLQPDFARLV